MEYLNMSLPQYNSTLQLSARFTDLFYVIIIPLISLAGFIEKSISIITLKKILSKKGNYGNIYHYMITNEIIDIINCSIIGFTFLFRCGSYCSFSYTYASKLYDMVFYIYFTNTLQQVQTFLEISFNIERLQSFTATNSTRIKFRTKLLIWIMIAVPICLPNYLISRTVSPVGLLNNHNQSELVYGVVNNSVGNNYNVQILLFILSILRGFILYNILFVISLIVIYKFGKHLQAKAVVVHDTKDHLQAQKNAKKQNKETRVTKMVLSMSLNYIIGSFLASLSPILFQIGVNSTIYGYYGSLANITSYLSHGSYFFLFYKYNPLFKRVFLETFCLESLTKKHNHNSHNKSNIKTHEPKN